MIYIAPYGRNFRGAGGNVMRSDVSASRRITGKGKFSAEIWRSSESRRWWWMKVVSSRQMELSIGRHASRAQSWWMARWALCSKVSDERNVRIVSRGLMWWFRYAGKTSAVDVVSHHSQLVVDSMTNRQPVELAQQRVCVEPPRCL